MSEHIMLSKECTGCGACKSVCPKNAISMKKDEKGFWNWKIDQKMCVECKKCMKGCPQLNEISRNEVKNVYGAVSKNEKILKDSTSGGIFYELAKLVLARGGLVYGVSYGENFTVKYIRVNSIRELKKIQGSKYVQAEIGNIYSKILEELEKGYEVIFSGTPCHVAGLKSFLKKDYNNLLTLDLLCHGVPSSLLFESYISWLEEKEGKKIDEFKFRYKDHGYGERYLLGVRTSNKIKKIPYMIDPYGDAFLKGKILNDACYSCKYVDIERVGDISLGDFWYFKERKNIENKSGVSMVLINTEKGKNYFDNIKSNVMWIESTVEDAITCNAALAHTCIKPDNWEQIYKRIGEKNLFTSILRPPFNLKIRLFNMIPIEVKEWLKSRGR